MEYTCQHATDSLTPDPAPQRQIGILLFDGVEELDAVGPWEVLSTWTQQHPEDGWTAFCFSPDGGPVRSAKTLPLGAHHSIEDAPAVDVLVHPGGPGTRPPDRPPAAIRRLVPTGAATGPAGCCRECRCHRRVGL